ncbi:J domain-containing protein [Myxosarcina sp. GI1]|uniref:J domain-containing protein n=1 Tax=Myxosarcina sp. GI1 TaxID=1541065 RepID=UPI00055E5A54|nr:J domain-containing protein [Myxosarcina sp. GI1]
MIDQPSKEELDYKQMRKECYQYDRKPQAAYYRFKSKYGYPPQFIWASNCFFNQRRKMTIASQLKFARYCCRHTSTSNEALEMMRLECGEVRFEQYKLKFKTACKEWESRISPNIESDHASKGYSFLKYRLVNSEDYEQSVSIRLRSDNIHDLNQMVTAWLNAPEGEKQRDRTYNHRRYFEPDSDEYKQRMQEYEASYQAREAECQRQMNDPEYQRRQQKAYQKAWEAYNRTQNKIKANATVNSAKFLTDTYNSLSELKKAYRSLSKQHHPDLGGKPESFRQLTVEYEALCLRFT